MFIRVRYAVQLHRAVNIYGARYHGNNSAALEVSTRRVTEPSKNESGTISKKASQLSRSFVETLSLVLRISYADSFERI